MPTRPKQTCPTCQKQIPSGKRCPTCMQRRGTNQQRGYGTTHQQTREHWKPLIATGNINCAICGKPIPPEWANTNRWHLDHTDDRTQYNGPTHAWCNTSKAAAKATRGNNK